MAGVIVRVDMVSKSFGEKTVLSQRGLTLAAGRVSVLMGPYGGGKTKLARLIAGLETPDSGRISFARRGEPCARPRLAYLFQEDRLLPWLNVYDNMALALLRSGGAGVAGGVLPQPAVGGGDEGVVAFEHHRAAPHFGIPGGHAGLAGSTVLLCDTLAGFPVCPASA